MLAVALGLGSGLAWGLADFLGGLASRRMALVAVLFVSQGTGLLLAAAVVAVSGEGPPASEYLVWAGLSAFAGVGGLAAFYRGLAVGAMAVVAPISATAAAVPVVVGVLSGERPSAAQTAGIVLAITGVMLASRERAPAGEPSRLAAGAGLALLAALGFGAFFVLIDQASEGDVSWSILANRIVGVSLLTGLVLALRPNLPTGAGDARLLVGIGALDIAANTLFAAASTEGLVSVVAVLASLYPVVTVLLARTVLHERVRGSQLAGVAVALAGVGLISAG